MMSLPKTTALTYERIGINKQQQIFADAYILNQDHLESAKIAGYSAPSGDGRRLLGNAKVRKYIKQRSDVLKNRQKDVTNNMLKSMKLESVDIMTHAWKQEQLKKIVVAVVGDGTDVNLRYASAAISAIAEANKMAGDYAPDKLEINVKTDADIIRLNSLCADMIEQKRAEIMKGLDITDYVEFKPAILIEAENAN